MSQNCDYQNDLDQFKNSASGYGYKLRLDLADIIYRHIAERNLTQKQIADKAGIKAPYLTRLLQGSQNWTADVAGRLLFAMGVSAELIESVPDIIQESQNPSFVSISNPLAIIHRKGITYAKEVLQSKTIANFSYPGSNLYAIDGKTTIGGAEESRTTKRSKSVQYNATASMG